MRRTAFALALGAGALLVACGGTSAPPVNANTPEASSSSTTGSTSASTSCVPTGTALQLSAKNLMYSTDCLAVRPNQAFVVHFDNMDDGVQHDFSIYTADPLQDPSAKNLFKGQLITGSGTIDYAVPALQAGTYHYHCDVHPTQMHGNLVVK